MEWVPLAAAMVILTLGICVLSALPLVSRYPLKGVPLNPGDCNLEYEEVNFSTSDGIVLHGWWFPFEGSTRTIIMLHGYAGSMDPDLKYVPDLNAAGFNLLMFDFRAHGRSGGHIGTIGALERKDVRAASQFVLARDSSRIGLLGFSMGGRAAILSAPLIPQVKAIVCDGGPARLTTSIAGRLTGRKYPPLLSKAFACLAVAGGSLLSGINLFRVEPLFQARRLVEIPTLFIYGGMDPFITSDEINKMVTDAGQKAEAWIVPQAGHRDVDQYLPKEYMRVILDFFKKTL